MRFTYQSGARPLAGYTIQRGIHRGGFGEVYFAHSDGGKEVALKLLHQQDQDIEIRGVTQCLNLKHPNLVNLFDLKTAAGGEHWVVMEYVSGSSLEDVMASFPDGLPLSEVRDWLSGLVAGVAYLHDRGIVHRDLKPANVYRENGVVKVGDVGLSKRLDSDRRRQHTGSVGTVYYMAPEVARGQYGPEVDVYSLGVMLYELITGKLPFTGETTAEILMKHLTAQPDLTVIPRALRPAMSRVLEKDPRKRTPTVRQLELEFARASGLPASPAVADSAALPPVPPLTNGGSNETSPWISIRVNRPTPKPPHETMRDFGASVRNSAWSPFAIFSVLLLILFAPQAYLAGPEADPRAWLGFLLIAGAYGVTLLHASKTAHASQTRNPESVPVPTFARPSPAKAETSIPVFTRRPPPPAGSHRPRPIRLAEWSQSFGMAGMVASLLSAGVYLSLGAFHRVAIMPSLEHAVWFASTAVAASWLVLINHARTLGPTWTKRQRFVTRLATGAVVGLCAFTLHELLLVNLPQAGYTSTSVFQSLGARPLTVAGIEPTRLGAAWFFAGLFGLRRWSRDLDPLRKHRFSLWSIAASVLVAFEMSMLFAFPQWYAVLWAGTISATLQLASPWTPDRSVAGWR